MSHGGSTVDQLKKSFGDELETLRRGAVCRFSKQQAAPELLGCIGPWIGFLHCTVGILSLGRKVERGQENARSSSCSCYTAPRFLK